MKKSLSAGISAALGLAAIVAAPSASAFNLNITTGTHTCLYGADAAQVSGCLYGAVTVTGGSYFNMGGSFANDLGSVVGLDVGVGTAQALQGTAGAPASTLDQNAGTNPGIDQNITSPWAFFALANYGVNFALSDLLLTDAGAGAATVDMSGWRVAWGEVPLIDMGQGADATFTYDGSNWTLDYSAFVPAGDPSGFGGAQYDLHLEGTYVGDVTTVIAPAAVPVPAAVWLFGSGLIGLVGVARRRKATV